MKEAGVTQPPFTPAQIEGFTDLIEKKIPGKMVDEKQLFRIYKKTTSYKRRTGLYRALIAKLQSRGYNIHESMD